jgi:hypothetical protein
MEARDKERAAMLKAEGKVTTWRPEKAWLT